MENNNSLVPGFDKETDDYLKISLKKLPNVQNGCLITLSGYIDTYNSTFFQSQITKVVSEGYFNLVFNCAALSYISSTGLGSFTNLLKMVRISSGDIVFAEVQPKVLEVFQLLGFSQFFGIKNTTEEAVAVFTHEAVSMNGIFPKILSCPSCGKNVRATRAGKFRCLGCKSVVTITEAGSIVLG